jgi:hypothetical protein
MKPFNLKDALEGKPVVTRAGAKVRELYQWKTLSRFPLQVTIEGTSDTTFELTLEGRFFDNSNDSSYDLFMASAIEEGWVAFGLNYAPETILVGFCTNVWPTEEEAKASLKRATGFEAKGTQRVSWED